MLYKTRTPIIYTLLVGVALFAFLAVLHSWSKPHKASSNPGPAGVEIVTDRR
jgi:hypothetical protein